MDLMETYHALDRAIGALLVARDGLKHAHDLAGTLPDEQRQAIVNKSGRDVAAAVSRINEVNIYAADLTALEGPIEGPHEH